jgi:hypothetical protein
MNRVMIGIVQRLFNYMFCFQNITLILQCIIKLQLNIALNLKNDLPKLNNHQKNTLLIFN